MNRRQIPPICRGFRQTFSAPFSEVDFGGLPGICMRLPASAELRRQTVCIASAAVSPSLEGNGKRQITRGRSIHAADRRAARSRRGER